METIKEKTILENSSFKIVDLGIHEKDVYDLEVDEYHNFFGNNILLHNSNIFIFNKNSEIYQKIIDNSENISYIVDIIKDWFYDKALSHIKVYFDDLKELCNTRDIPIKFDLETIMSDMLFTDKKKYCWRLWYKDGIIFEKDKFKHTGLSYIKSDTPLWCKAKLKKFTTLVLTTKDEKLLKAYIKKCEKVFKDQPLSKISRPGSINTLNNYDKESSGVPPAADAALSYNIFIKDNNLKQYNPLTVDSGKIKWIYVNPKNKYGFDKIAIVDDGAIKEVTEFFEIDYEKQFEATFMSLPTRVFEVCNWKLSDKKEFYD